MTEYRIDGWIISCDSQETRLAYSRTARGAHDCECASCRNYLAVRDQYYPLPFLQMLAQLGIDEHKEAEVYEMGPQGSGRLYGGWYHFAGRVIQDGGGEVSFRGGQADSPVWQVLFCENKRDLALDTFRTPDLVQLEFIVELPWRLFEPPDW